MNRFCLVFVALGLALAALPAGVAAQAPVRGNFDELKGQAPPPTLWTSCRWRLRRLTRQSWGVGLRSLTIGVLFLIAAMSRAERLLVAAVFLAVGAGLLAASIAILRRLAKLAPGSPGQMPMPLPGTTNHENGAQRHPGIVWPQSHQASKRHQEYGFLVLLRAFVASWCRAAVPMALSGSILWTEVVNRGRPASHMGNSSRYRSVGSFRLAIASSTDGP